METMWAKRKYRAVNNVVRVAACSCSSGALLYAMGRMRLHRWPEVWASRPELIERVSWAVSGVVMSCSAVTSFLMGELWAQV
jgi:hypothetical protein